MPDSVLSILLVEDDRDHADLIRLHLTRGRGYAVAVTWAAHMAEAVERLVAQRFDAVVLDMMLPDSRGVETVSRIHEHAPYVPIVVLTSAEDDELALEAVHRGAEDYIPKTQVNAQSLVRAIRYAIERCGRRHAESALESARYEMGLAQKIQRSLYPHRPPDLPGFDLAGVSYPATSVGGDYFDFFRLADDQHAIAIGDVSGHGLGPAILMAETRAALRTLARTTSNVGETLTLANNILLDGMAEGRYVTLLLAGLDTQRKALTFASAGHPDGLIFNPDGSLCRRLESTGCPLGVLPDECYEPSAPVELAEGQIVLLMTDGITEASPAGPRPQPLGLARVVETVREHRHLPATQILEKISALVREHRRTADLEDDVTAVALKVGAG